MNNFKESDIVWFFTTRNPKDSNDIAELCGDFSLHHIHLTSGFYGMVDPQTCCYSTKEEAIDNWLYRVKEFENV